MEKVVELEQYLSYFQLLDHIPEDHAYNNIDNLYSRHLFNPIRIH